MPRLSSFVPTLKLRTNPSVEVLQTRHRIITGYLQQQKNIKKRVFKNVIAIEKKRDENYKIN